MSFGADPAQRGKVTSALSQAAGAGLTVTRTWAFSDGGSNALQYSPGRYNETTFQGLDFVLSEARKHGIRMILSLVNSYDSFGGRKHCNSGAFRFLLRFLGVESFAHLFRGSSRRR
uniref:mannan endo-1,4-beta-mannosidase n=1 Tax=Setaria viridis TaxID=4556 RepID=A0A4U6UI82_SETVI|nr:hypothetical protein SEVIR_5G263075v2 [Setaria viridis]